MERQKLLDTCQFVLKVYFKTGLITCTKFKNYIAALYEGQSKITESWLIYLLTGPAVLAETLCTYRMNLWASLHIEIDVLSSSMRCC